MKIFSPLEQFEILPLITFFKVDILDVTITNQTITLFLIFFLLVTFFFSTLKLTDTSFYMIPTAGQLVGEFIYEFVLSVVINNIKGDKSQRFFPLILTLFIFVASMNVIGLIPYTFTISCHLISTAAMSLTIFIGINILSIRIHNLRFFSLFLPSGTPLQLSFLLVPIEFILYLFRPFSLAIRLSCNMIAGHTLLKVLAGSAWSLMCISSPLFFFHFVPVLILPILFVLELCVAFIQAFVFSLFICIYIDDAINLH
jgi:F-type H+-transporting ATPase subunit a